MKDFSFASASSWALGAGGLAISCQATPFHCWILSSGHAGGGSATVPGTPVTGPVTVPVPPLPSADSVTGQLLRRLNPFGKDGAK